MWAFNMPYNATYILFANLGWNDYKIGNMGGESPLRHGKVTCDAAVLYDFTGPGQLDALVPWLEEECHTQVYAPNSDS